MSEFVIWASPSGLPTTPPLMPSVLAETAEIVLAGNELPTLRERLQTAHEG